MSTPLPANTTLSEQLASLLRENGMSQKDLAQVLGVSQPAIGRLMSPSYDGHSVRSLRRIAEAVGCELELHFVSRTQTQKD